MALTLVAWRPLVTGTIRAAYGAGQLAVGDHGAVEKTITAADVACYAALLGDSNPLHLDARYAAGTPFRRPIAHGLLPAGLIPTIFGAAIPGSVYATQSLAFKRPVYVGDTVRALVTVTHVRAMAARHEQDGRRLHVTCSTSVALAAGGPPVIEGTATVVLPPPPPAA
jgi:3-hydroxybutyryl-CoA dehydratase